MGKSVEISVGTVFEVQGYKNRTDVITNTEEEKLFQAAKCIVKGCKLTIVAAPGTCVPKTLSNVLDQFSKDEVEKKMIEYYEKQLGKELDEDFIKTIHDGVAGPTRRINLD